MTLKIKKLHKDAVVPVRAHPDDAGLDVYCFADIIIPPHQTVKVSAGISYEGQTDIVFLRGTKAPLGQKELKL
jgi:dUTPase